MKPIELFRFVMGNDVWTFTSSDAAVNYNGERYVPVSIGRGQLESKNELSKANMEVRLDVMNELCRLLLRTYQEQVLGLTLFIQTPLGTDTAWKGRLSSTKPTDTHLILSFESVFTSLRRPGLRARYQKTCRYALYGRGCKLNVEDFAVNGEARSVSGVSVQVPEADNFGDGYFTGGMIRSPDGLLGFVVAHVGDLLTLQRPMPSLTRAFEQGGYGMAYGEGYGGTPVKIYPGCDHIHTTCKNKFNNLDNYGGFPWIPHKSPMDGSSIV
jgi:hypothetical protein